MLSLRTPGNLLGGNLPTLGSSAIQSSLKDPGWAMSRRSSISPERETAEISEWRDGDYCLFKLLTEKIEDGAEPTQPAKRCSFTIGTSFQLDQLVLYLFCMLACGGRGRDEVLLWKLICMATTG